MLRFHADIIIYIALAAIFISVTIYLLILAPLATAPYESFWLLSRHYFPVAD